MIVGDEIYSAKGFRNSHPGGALFVSMFGGRDATEAFMEYHSRKFPRDLMASHLVGKLDASEKAMMNDENYLALAKEIFKLIPNRGFAPSSYWVKLTLLVGFAFAVEWHLLFVYRSIAGALFLGWLYALIGLNVQHDANHGAISKNGTVNWFFGLFQDYIGGSSILWLQEHVVLHHLFCNDTELDPDIALGAPAIRLNPTHGHLPWYTYQHLYVFPGQAMFGFKLLFLDFVELVRYQWVGEKISPLANYMYLPSILMKFAFWARFVVAPFALSGLTLHTAATIAATTCAGAFYLAFFFTLSHNFDGVGHIGQGGSLTRDDSFVKRQAETSSNVGGAWLAVLNGGLNYQIEHHLFPRVHHSHYATMSPLVKAHCEKHAIKYTHYATVPENIFAMLRHLRKLGRPDGKFSLSAMVSTLGKVLLDKHD
jgi:fatty acid desaturase (delta-4 desaturase)